LDTLSTNDDGNLDARFRRIVNLADPVDDGDALNYGTYKEDKQGVYEASLSAKDSADKALKASQEVAKNTEIVTTKTEQVISAQTDVSEKQAQVSEDASEVSTNTQIVLEAKDYIQELVNIEPVKDGLACSKATWTVNEEIPEGTEITIPEGVSYVVGRKHVFVSYDGIVASPTFYKEIGDFNTVSSKISLTFPVKSGTELSVWVVPLGTIDNSLYDRVKVLEDALADLSRRVAYATDADDK